MRRRFQKGFLLKRNDNWFLRYYDTVLARDGTTRRKLCFSKLDVPENARSKAVKAAAAEFLAPFNAGALDIRSSTTLIDFVENTYVPEHVATLRPASQRQYKTAWNLYIKPQVKKHNEKITLRGFRTVDGEMILKTIGKETNEKTKKKPARSSLFHAKSFLSGAFKQARRLGVLSTPNPMIDTSIPKTPATDETHAYSLPEVQAMLNVLGEPSRTVILTAAFTGLRKSELWGLEWDDFDGKMLRIQRSIWNGHEGELKTKASRASIPVVPVLADALEDHRESQGRLAVGPIFQNGMGTPQNLDNLARRFIRPALNRCATCKKPEVNHPTEGHMYERDPSLPEWFGWHAFRRGLATNLHELGVPDREIQAILRHDDIHTTQRSYIKSIAKSSTDAMEKLASGLTITNHSLKQGQRTI